MTLEVYAKGEQGLDIRVRVTPNSDRNALVGPGENAEGVRFLKARVRVPPEDGKANRLVEALLARALGIPRTSVRVIRGETKKLKSVLAYGDPFALERRLLGLLEPKQ